MILIVQAYINGIMHFLLPVHQLADGLHVANNNKE